MNRVFSIGPKLIATLTLMLFSGVLMAQNSPPASYVKPGIDLSRYKKLMIRPLNVANIEVLKPEWEKDNTDVWTLELSNMRKIQTLFNSSMKMELETRGGYELVRDPGPDVLRVEVEILSMTPYVKQDTPGRDGRFKIQALGSGDLVFSAEFRDSLNRELLILVEGERTTGDANRELSPENYSKNLQSLFTEWSVKVRESLDKALNK